ncbi:unnamed protein product [Arctia plantaginis]|uniref:Uncharacterized protein n=1 Tax=Arctia plantaginis TaxID=874455 RepID=A0A8S1A608_ARCPL|nr:unnamed protein product [Arctia plantaginis]
MVQKLLDRGMTKDALSLSLLTLPKKTSEHVIALVLRSGAAARRCEREITKPAGRHNRLRQQAAQRSGGRAAGRPRRATGVSHTVGGVTTLGTARAGARARIHEHAASGATERGRRCSERSSLRTPAPPPSSPPLTARAFSRTHQNDEFIFRACWPCYSRTLPRVFHGRKYIRIDYIQIKIKSFMEAYIKLRSSELFTEINGQILCLLVKILLFLSSSKIRYRRALARALYGSAEVAAPEAGNAATSQ